MQEVPHHVKDRPVQYQMPRLDSLIADGLAEMTLASTSAVHRWERDMLDFSLLESSHLGNGARRSREEVGSVSCVLADCDGAIADLPIDP